MPILKLGKSGTGGEDTFVLKSTTTSRNTNYGTNAKLRVQNDATHEAIAYLIGTIAAAVKPAGSAVQHAYLKLHLNAAAAGGTLRVAHCTSAFIYNRTTYNYKKPAGDGVYFVDTVIAPGATGWLTIDITTMMNAVWNGTIANWYGLRLSMTAASSVHLFDSMNSRVVGGNDYRPYIEVEYSRRPDAPTVCSPSGTTCAGSLTPRVTWNFNDPDGREDTQYGFRVYIYQDDGTTLVHDSGDQVSSNQFYDVPGGAGLAWGTFYKWKVKVQDQHLLWSSDSIQFRFKPNRLPTIAFTDPAGATVDKVTPTIAWSFSDLDGDAQWWYRLTLYDKRVGTSTWRQVWSSGRINSLVQECLIPAGYIKNEVDDYRLELQVCDAVVRAPLPNLLPYTQVTKDIKLALTAGTGGIDTIDAHQETANRPGVHVTWTRAAGNPDSWQVWRWASDDVSTKKLVAELDDGALRQYTDYTAASGVHYHYEVWAVVGGKPSNTNPNDSADPVFEPYWLVCPDDPTLNVPIPYWEGSNFQRKLGEDSTLFEPKGRRDGVLVTQGIKGMRGTYSADVITYGGYTARQIYNGIQKLRITPYSLWVVGINLSWEVDIFDVGLDQKSEFEESYALSFNYSQKGDYDVPA